MKIGLLSILILISGLTYCAKKPVSISVAHKDSVLMQCDKAEVMELSPAGGGFRFHCPGGLDAYFMYGTSGEPEKIGKLIGVDISNPNLSAEARQIKLPNQTEPGAKSACKEVSALSGKFSDPLPERSAWDKGPIRIPTSVPCGEIVVTIGSAP